MSSRDSEIEEGEIVEESEVVLKGSEIEEGSEIAEASSEIIQGTAEPMVEEDSRSRAANCLMLLSRVGETAASAPSESEKPQPYSCKTCGRTFESFQALGGHRASHRSTSDPETGTLKPKTHDCKQCGREFSIGQALGGHMRRHRNAALAEAAEKERRPLPEKEVPVLKKNKRVMLFGFDLNLPPMEDGRDGLV